MQYRPVALAPIVAMSAILGACWADVEVPEAVSCEEPARDLGIDIEVAGLEPSGHYVFAIDTDVANLSFARTPERQATISETPLDDDRQLLVVLFDSRLRVYIDDANGMLSGPAITTVSIYAGNGGDLLARETFEPDYTTAVPDPDACTFAVVTEHMSVAP